MGDMRPGSFLAPNRLTFRASLREDAPMSTLKPLNRHRLRRGLPMVLYRQAPDRERAGAGAGCAGRSALAAVLLNSWVPREGISRDEYLTAKFGSVEAYKGIAGRVVAAAGEEGLTYRPDS